ncbi:hypothetical protein KAI87_06195, partial [Myxococcota bacterium]|nr:hypothetical protein [Myxococcota bacterium]
MKQIFSILATLILFSAVLPSCTGPCKALAEMQCECDENEATRNSCLQQVDTKSEEVDPTDQEKEECEELMDSCTCEKLEA